MTTLFPYFSVKINIICKFLIALYSDRKNKWNDISSTRVLSKSLLLKLKLPLTVKKLLPLFTSLKMKGFDYICFNILIHFIFSESPKICKSKKCKSSKCKSKSVPERKRVKSNAKTPKRKKIAKPEPEDESEDDTPVDYDEEQTRSPGVTSPRNSPPVSPASSEYSNGF